MILIFKLTDGQEIIGDIEENLLTTAEYYTIVDPMTIMDSTAYMEEAGYGGMRLRDTLLLSDDDSIVIPSKFCITTYNPSQSLVSYYTKARLYYKKYTKKDIDRQIEEAAADMEQSIHERETSTKTIAEILSKLSIPKGKLH
jgi:hypothetical protein